MRIQYYSLTPLTLLLMTKQSILNLAKQGDIKAIASVLNFLLKEKGITAKAFLKDDCLRVMLESNQIPEKQSSIDLIYRAMMKLDIKSIKQVTIYGKQTDHNFAAWNESLDLSYEVEKPNTQTDLDKITHLWPAWFPYPSSWFRALILVPIAFPGAILILIGFGGITASTITNQPFFLIFFTLIGFLLPAAILAIIYHIAWFRWEKPKFLTNLFKFRHGSNSLWEGLYATLVIGLSFSFILTIIAMLVYSACNSAYGASEELLYRCMGRGVRQTARVIFYRINDFEEWNDDKFTAWFAIWLITAAYLYQIEFLIRRRFNPKQLAKGLLMCVLALWTTQIVYFGSRTFSDFTETSVPIVSETPLTQPSISTEVTTPSRGAEKDLSSTSIEINPAPTLSEQPLPVTYSNSEVIPKSIVSNSLSSTPAVTTSKANSRTQTLTYDPFREAVNKAMSAANFAQSSKSKNDWNEVANLWQEAITFMKAVPVSHTNYEIAQKKVVEYQRNSDYALSKAIQAK